MEVLVTIYFILGTMIEVEYTGKTSPAKRKLIISLLRILWPLALLLSRNDANEE